MISAAAKKRRIATSPEVRSLLFARPSVVSNPPAPSVAPTAPTPFRNERRRTTRCQRAVTSSVVGEAVATFVSRYSAKSYPPAHAAGEPHRNRDLVPCNRYGRGYT